MQKCQFTQDRLVSLTAALLIFAVTGCGTKANSTTKPPDTTPPVASNPGPRTYFAPYVAGTTNGNAITLLTGPKIYTVDDSSNKFSQSIFALPQGPQVINAGTMTAPQNGLLSLTDTVNYTKPGGSYVPNTSNLPNPGFAIELPDQAGGLVQLAGQPMSPLVAALQCPVLASAQTWQFLTIPGGLYVGEDQIAATWNPMTDTAYGTVDITSDGTSVTLTNIHQYTLPSVGGSGVPAQQPSSPLTGLCGSTVLGSTISVPGQEIVKNPGTGSGTPPQATIGIGPTGLMVEHNGAGDPSTGTLPNTSPALEYNNVLGAGTGAIGLPKPSSALDTGALLGTKYLGFVYGAGVSDGNPSAPPTGWSSHLVSFGLPATTSGCPSVGSGTTIYGGDFPNDDPSTAPGGIGNCDVAIDLGSQDAAGLFSNATVYFTSSYAAGKANSFPAVAIAGKLGNNYTIFLLGFDSTQPWAIYLLQSN